MYRSHVTLTCRPLHHCTGLCWAGRTTEVEDESEAVLIPSRVEDGTVELSLILPLCQPFVGQLSRKLRFLCARGGGPGGDPRPISVQNHLPTGEGTGRGDQAHRQGPLAATPVGAVHQQLVGEDARQIERHGGLDLLQGVGRLQGHSDEVVLSEGEGAAQLHVLRLQSRDVVLRLSSDLVDAVLADLIVLQVGDFQE